MQFASETMEESNYMVMEEGVDDEPRSGPLFPALSATDASVTITCMPGPVLFLK